MITPEVQEVLNKYPERKQVLLIGMETQICITQTCLHLLPKKYQVYLLVDAITSLRSWERTVALRRLEKLGAVLTTFESSFFELLKDSKDGKFKQIIAVLKDHNRTNAISHL